MRARLLLPLVALLGFLPVLFLRAQGENPHGPTLQLDCGECHTPERWTPVDRTPTFRHETTGFLLVDNHARAHCRDCHRSLILNRVGTACADCHKDVHRGELGFRCEACHSLKTWTNQQEMFRVHNRTRFPLFAAHASVDCEACHHGQQPYQYVGTPTECGACHARTYEATRNPDHARAGFPRQCEGCHTITSTTWAGATFRHDSFFLRGAHVRATCEQCHPGGRYQGTSRDCVGCHRRDYDNTRNPGHLAANFPTDCASCHAETAWRPATGIDHDRTRFPLRGAHVGLDCARCHRSGQYAGTPTQCASCHEANYQAARNPNHVASNFPRQCETCHNVSAWRPASFDHDRTRFPLTGAHRNVACDGCHRNGQYTGTPTDCYACHQSRYEATTNPNHRASSFPTTCASCHTTSGWRPATFDHDGPYFPIYSGKHRSKWSSCGDCHTNPSNYRVFSCLGCHPHSDRAKTDEKHKEVSGYRYDSQACYQCHPRGSGD